MKAQTPAEGISKLSNYGGMYRFECDCCSEDHAVTATIDVEGDKEDGCYVSMSFYVNMYTPFSSLWQRIKIATTVLFKGFYEVQHELILKHQAAINISTAIQNEIKEAEELINKRKEEK